MRRMSGKSRKCASVLTGLRASVFVCVCVSVSSVMQGDPSAAPYAVENAKAILGKKPVFGICMGHQILGQAFGGKTFKLKFGHHGGNHPIRAPTGTCCTC